MAYKGVRWQYFMQMITPCYKVVYIFNLTCVNVHVILERNEVKEQQQDKWHQDICAGEEYAAVSSVTFYIVTWLIEQKQDKIRENKNGA